MQVSELIVKLEKIKADYGDMDILITSCGDGSGLAEADNATVDIDIREFPGSELEGVEFEGIFTIIHA